MVFISLERQKLLAFFDNIIILMDGSRNFRRNHYVDNSHFKMLIYSFYAAMCNEIKTFLFLYSEQPKDRYFRQLLYKNMNIINALK